MKKLFLILLSPILIFSCSSDDSPISLDEIDYLIFGHFYGECFGEGCIETFKLTSEKLFEDTLDNYNGEPLNFEELDNDKFEQVKDLANSFPKSLLSESENFIGCPDCSDGGGIFIVYSKNGIKKSWRIDQFKTNIPDYLHDFIDNVNEKISLINEN